ncbi:MAG: murein peptide amidase [Verrucomicrobiota bacterium]|jgi:hypothetical protein
MSKILNQLSDARTVSDGLQPERRIAELLAPLDLLAAKSSSLIAWPIGNFERDGRQYEIPRYIFVGPQDGDTSIPIGIFAGVHGDEPEGVRALVKFVRLLESKPEWAAGYCLFIYPICNPTGLEANTAFSSNGKDLNREMIKFSAEPEVSLLQAELAARPVNGIIKLHNNRADDAFHALARGETLAKHLLEPALALAAGLLKACDGGIKFCARDTSYDHYEGGLSKLAEEVPVAPFEIALETPVSASVEAREAALVAALVAILAEYRKFLAYAPNL